MAEQRRRKSRKSELASTPPTPVEASVRCPYCHDQVSQDALAARCASCKTVHHPTCFDERGGCSVTGCAGKVADVVKGWRAAFAPCKVCQRKIYLDENVFLCKSCETPHHPGCLEASSGCAECGSGEGTMLYAGAYRDATERAKRWAAPFLFGRWLAVFLGGVGFASPFVPLHLRVATVLVAVAIWLGFTWFGDRIRARGHRRARELAQPRPAVVAASKPKGEEPAAPASPPPAASPVPTPPPASAPPS